MMTFMVYKHQGGRLLNRQENFSLAGYNLVYKAWIERERPTNLGWHLSADDLIRLITKGKESYQTRRLLIDFHPGSDYRIGIIELLDLYLYTWAGNSPSSAGWTPMMLRLRDVLYDDDYGRERPLTPERKANVIRELRVPTENAESVEFLYLNGDDGRWNWGRNGMTNAAFLHGGARDFFREFF